MTSQLLINDANERERLLIKIRAQRALANAQGGKDLRAPFYYYVPDYNALFLDRFLKYILLKGGRGSCKTINACCFLIDESFDYTLRGSLFLFCREVQSSVGDSVYAVVKSMIEQAHLTPYFRITNTRIVNKLTGIEFAFIGLRATGGKTAFSQVNKIKGKFKVKYLFIDESQDLTEDTINVLFPTVNRSSSIAVVEKPWHPKNDTDSIVDPDTRFIFAMNPNQDTDPIIEKLQTFQHQAMIKKERSNTAIMHRNIFDVPAEFQDAQLLAEAELEKDQVYYDHVWLGKASHKLGGYPFNETRQITMDGGNVRILGAFLDPSFKGGDYTALSFVGMVNGSLIAWGKVWPAAWNRVIDKIKIELKRTPPDFFWYEENALQSVVADKFGEVGITAIGHTTTGNKENRIYKVAGFTADRMVIVANLCNAEYVSQVIKYNDQAEYDDAPDSLASCLIKCGIIPEKVKF